MPESLEANATVPMHYVICIDNSKFSGMSNCSDWVTTVMRMSCIIFVLNKLCNWYRYGYA